MKLTSATIEKTGAVGPTGTSDVGVRVEMTDGDVDVQVGVVRFPPVTGGGSLALDGVTFRGAPNTSVAVTRSASLLGGIAVDDFGHLIFAGGDHTLNDMLVVLPDARMTLSSGSFSGGTWTGDGLAHFAGGEVNEVLNQGNLRWGGGTFGPGGFVTAPIGERFMATGAVVKGGVGEARALLFSTRALVDFARSYFEAELPG